MNAIKLKSIQNSMVSAKNNSARSVSIFKAYSRFHTLNKDSFSAFANIESFSVTGSSLKRQNTQNIYSWFW